MAKTDFRSHADYLAALPAADAEAIGKMRAAVLAAVPDAEEVISYQLPAFKYHGWLCYLSAATRHYSLSFPPPFSVFAVFADELGGYGLSRSALRLPKDRPLPLDLITRMARFRADENVARARSRVSAG
ncbi:DUF1801 domain-containing protein [Devosia sp.]|uniref:iron chaperone n=1 Tax=Devosia sp. TaxID=1871048 RepID=UPI001AC146B0|nr:DUF1801 domain-containing protein [Devosia sp.]MBN9309505.1 DUF1801 domain-containing protein [Devosia sp.]